MSGFDERLQEAGLRRITEAEEEWIDDHQVIARSAEGIEHNTGPTPGTWWEDRGSDDRYVSVYVVPIDWRTPDEEEQR